MGIHRGRIGQDLNSVHGGRSAASTFPAVLLEVVESYTHALLFTISLKRNLRYRVVTGLSPAEEPVSPPPIQKPDRLRQPAQATRASDPFELPICSKGAARRGALAAAPCAHR